MTNAIIRLRQRLALITAQIAKERSIDDREVGKYYLSAVRVFAISQEQDWLMDTIAELEQEKEAIAELQRRLVTWKRMQAAMAVTDHDAQRDAAARVATFEE